MNEPRSSYANLTSPASTHAIVDEPDDHVLPGPAGRHALNHVAVLLLDEFVELVRRELLPCGLIVERQPWVDLGDVPVVTDHFAFDDAFLRSRGLYLTFDDPFAGLCRSHAGPGGATEAAEHAHKRDGNNDD